MGVFIIFRFFFGGYVYEQTDMNTDFTLADSYVPLGGGLKEDSMAFIEGFSQKWVGAHYVAAFFVILGLIVVVWILWRREKFNPTQTLRAADSDQFGLGKERLDVGRAGSYFAQALQGPAQSAVQFDPNAAAGQPGSYAWQILHSKDYACDTRSPVDANAWDWMNTQLHSAETMDVGRASDNDLTKVLAGY